jgi:hypothetical protein
VHYKDSVKRVGLVHKDSAKRVGLVHKDSAKRVGLVHKDSAKRVGLVQSGHYHHLIYFLFISVSTRNHNFYCRV